MLVEANRLLDRMREAGVQPDRETYHLLLGGYRVSVSKGGNAKSHLARCQAILERMRREGVQPDAASFELVLGVVGGAKLGKGWQRRDRTLSTGLQVFEELTACKVPPTARVFRALMRCARSAAGVNLVLEMAAQHGVPGADSGARAALYEAALLALRPNAGGDEVAAAAALVARAEAEACKAGGELGGGGSGSGAGVGQACPTVSGGGGGWKAACIRRRRRCM